MYYKANALVSPATQRLSYVIATVAPAVLLVALWPFADRLRFDILLPGLAWRTYFVLTTLPGALARWRRGPKSQEAKAAVNQSSNGGRAIASYFDRRGVSLGF